MKFCSIILILMTSVACKDSSPNPSDMTGLFKVTAALKDDFTDRKGISASIDKSLDDAEKELRIAKEEMEKEWNLSAIDTTTSEGKMEYAAKKFAKSIGEVGLNLGDLSEEIGGLFGDLAASGLGFAEALLKNISMELELQPDGDIKSKSRFFNLGFNNARWEVQGNQFLLIKDNTEKDTFFIAERNDKGFTLEKDQIILTFSKKP